MRNRICIWALCLLVAVAHAEGTVITGTFLWDSDTTAASGTAGFSFDTTTGIGSITELYSRSLGYGSYGSWSFQLSISGRNLLGDTIVTNSFADLTDFSTRDIQVFPQFSFDGVLVPYSVQGELVWDFSSGSSAYGTLSQERWSTRENVLFNPLFDGGSVMEFTESVPEVSGGVYCILSGLLFSSLYRNRINKSEQDAAVKAG